MMLLGFSTETVLNNKLKVGKVMIPAVLRKLLYHCSWIYGAAHRSLEEKKVDKKHATGFLEINLPSMAAIIACR